MSAYAELHALSNFSFLRGASHPAELIAQAHALGYRALALTDECSLAGVVRAHEAQRKLNDRNFKLIIGAEFRTVCGVKLVLLAPSQRAYAQICQLITLGRRRGCGICSHHAAGGRWSCSAAPTMDSALRPA